MKPKAGSLKRSIKLIKLAILNKEIKEHKLPILEMK